MNVIDNKEAGDFMYEIKKVENPTYLSKEEIEKKYWDNQLLLTNMKFTPRTEPYAWLGGKVLYYSKGINEMLELLSETIKEHDAAGKSRDELGEVGVFYVGDVGHVLVNIR